MPQMPKKRRNINWKRAQVIQLLKLFQQRRILYDPKEEDYRNKGRRSLELAKSVRVLRQAMPKLSEKAVENKFGSQSAGPTVALLVQFYGFLQASRSRVVSSATRHQMPERPVLVLVRVSRHLIAVRIATRTNLCSLNRSRSSISPQLFGNSWPDLAWTPLSPSLRILCQIRLRPQLIHFRNEIQCTKVQAAL
ncbi:uncharacterized protein LOC117590411 [Drosophila guanche]|uniref:uncharacterized protein LOC117590411 n=1 Tax=Drosophila guanche TaxID=7266 RepID=UPI001470F5E4|nr:uncharacterized protein LOC117590411 [Drosophila guanche]